MHTFSEPLRLRKIRQFALHPDQIAVRCVCDCPIHCTLTAALVSVVSFSRPRRVPIEKDVHARDALRDGARLCVALALALGQKLLDQALLVDMHARVDRVDDRLVEELQAGLRRPLVLDALEVVARFPARLGGEHQVVQRLQRGVRAAQDEGVVARVDGRGDQGGGFGVGAGHGQQIRAHDVGLGADGDESVDVLADGDEHFARHVSAFLGAWGLVFNVDAGGPLFDEEFGELHDGCEATVACVGVGNDGSQIVDIGNSGSLVFWCREALFPLFAVVEELCEPEMLDFVGDCGLEVCQQQSYTPGPLEHT